MKKEKLRKAIKQKLSKLDKCYKDRVSTKAVEKICNLKVFKKANIVGLYAPLPNEVNLLDLLASGKIFCFPQYDELSKAYRMVRVDDYIQDMQRAKYNILEPKENCPIIEKTQIDLWFVPALAFDNQGNRLGRGRGYYDRLLANSTAFKIGIGFACQFVEKVPIQEYDKKVNQVLLAT